MTSSTPAPPVASRPVSSWEKPALALILLAAAGLRLYGIHAWLLANVDEVSALNQIGVPFLAGASTHSNYLLTTVLLKTVGVVFPFPLIRILTACTNVAALYAVFWTLRSLAGRTAAFLTVAVLTLSWNELYYSRIFECGSFDPSAACFFLACMLRWLRDRSQIRWLVGAGLLLGFHFNTHALPCCYAMAVLAAYLAWEWRARRLPWSAAIVTGLAFALGAIPYLYTSIAYPHFDSALGASYGTLGMTPSLHWAVNFRHPLYSLRPLAEYLTFYPLPADSVLLPAFALFAVLAAAAGAGLTPAGPLKRFLAFLTFGILIAIGLSPFPVYNEGHLHFFWPAFLALLGLLIRQGGRALRTVLVATLAAIAALNLVWLPHVFQDQVAAVEEVVARRLDPGETVYLSDGAELKLQWLSVSARLETHPLVRFLCQGPEAMQPFRGLNLDRKALVILTSDAPWPPEGFGGRIEDTLLLSQEQLMEAYQSHGLRIYEIRPAAAARGGSP